jgi:protein-tyrosine phosphatase
MIDLHAHLLPGVDDGPPDLPSALALAAAAVAEGTRVMAATPHIGYAHGIDPRALAGRADALRAALADAGIPLEVAAGGELAPDRALDLSEDELRAIALGGSRCLLLECPFTRAGDLMARLVAHLQRRGFRVLLAHPERSPSFLGDPAALRALVERGAYAQLTAGSLLGVFGGEVRRASRTFLEQGLVHVVASDAHAAAGGRSPALASVVAATLGEWRQDGALAGWLCADAPQALLADAELPPAPAWRARRRLLRRR